MQNSKKTKEKFQHMAVLCIVGEDGAVMEKK
jgi:hypothetical protein